MRKIKNKLIVSDFDGTLLTSDNSVPDEVRSAISEYVSSGGIFAVCTGRMLCSILPRVRELGLKGLVVAYQGTVIAEIESGKIIKRDCIESGDVSIICRYLESIDQPINVYSNEVLYTNLKKDDIYLRRYEEITGVDAVSVDEKISDYVVSNKLNCQKVACLVHPEERDNLYNKLALKFGGRFDVTCSANVLVEVSPICNNKGKALEFIAQHYSVPLSSSVAVGDNLNDLSMIKKAGTGVAVGNAVQLLKEAADYVSVSNNECALAKIIEKYGFE